MNTALSLAHTVNLEKESYVSINDLVKSSSQVIAPLGPVNTFAARSPWMGLEDQTFEQVARKIKDICDVEMYPNDSVLQVAWNRGEINRNHLEMKLQDWLDLQSLELPREVAEQFCRTALMMNQQSFEPLEESELKRLSMKLSHFKLKIPNTHSIQTYSQRIERLSGENITNGLNSHIIKWCKLFLDESQAVWSMPNREEGFFQAWKRLVQHDPSLNHTVRNELKNVPNSAEQALQEALLALEIPFSEVQDYLEAHLLALPGWAGMMLWRSQQSTQENSLLAEYLAVRISMEWAFIKPHLPLPNQKVWDQELLESLIESWVNWGGPSDSCMVTIIF